MEAVCSEKYKYVNFYQTTWRHNPEVDVAALESIFEKFTIKQKSHKGKTQIRKMPAKAILSFQGVTETWRRQ